MITILIGLGIVFINALFALTLPLGKQALYFMSPVQLIAVRMIIASGFFLSYYYYAGIYTHKKESRSYAFSSYVTWIWLALWYVVGAYIPEFWALQYLTTFKVNLLWSSQPFLAAMWEWFAEKKQFSWQQIVALGIGFTSVLFLVSTSTSEELCHATVEKMWWAITPFPELAMLVAVMSSLYGWILVRRLQAQGISLVLINGMGMGIGGAVCLAIALLFSSASIASVPILAWWYVIWLVLIGNIAAYYAYGFMLSRIDFTFLSMTNFLCPVWGLLFGVILHEPISFIQIFALCGIIAALLLYHRGSMHQKAY